MALEMRATCERCHATLDPAGEAYVCSFECTFCRACEATLRGVCPNCGGELLARPRRGPKAEPRVPPGPEAIALSDQDRRMRLALAAMGIDRVGQEAIASTPAAPYYLVAFTSQRTDRDAAGYGATSERMVELAARQPGYLGIESARAADGVGITLSYWRGPDDIRAWKAVEEHRQAQQRGRGEWYGRYRTRVALVERDYAWEAPPRER